MLGGTSVMTEGCVDQVDATTFRVTELPPRRSIESFKAALLDMQAAGQIKSFREQHTERDMEFIIKLTPDQMEAVQTQGGPVGFFKLSSPMSLNNMHLFDADGRIQRYETPEDIVRAHVPIRLRLYEARHRYMLQQLDRDLARITKRQAFVAALVSGQLALMARPRADVVADMLRLGLADAVVRARTG